MVEAAIETYQNLFSGKSVKQTSPDSDIVYNTVPLPNLVILDVSLDHHFHKKSGCLILVCAVFLLPDNDRHS